MNDFWWNIGVKNGETRVRPHQTVRNVTKKKPGAAHHDGPETQSMTNKSGAHF